MIMMPGRRRASLAGEAAGQIGAGGGVWFGRRRRAQGPPWAQVAGCLHLGGLLLASGSGPEGAGSMRGGGLAGHYPPAGIKGALRARGAAAYLQIEL